LLGSFANMSANKCLNVDVKLDMKLLRCRPYRARNI